jgi:hypothetical protein
MKTTWENNHRDNAQSQSLKHIITAKALFQLQAAYF